MKFQSRKKVASGIALLVTAISLTIFGLAKFDQYVKEQTKASFDKQMSTCDQTMLFFDQTLGVRSEQQASDAVKAAEEAVNCYETASFSGDVGYKLKEARYKLELWKSVSKDIEEEKLAREIRQNVFIPYDRFEKNIRKATDKIRNR